ncbi:hypothetical protein RB195_019980 [Necator americanus]|uniref:Uncharacterized protein n=1 Tax=Necator americanus TaxID=51031 RepID=A0ABR1CGN0_NECAM
MLSIVESFQKPASVAIPVNDSFGTSHSGLRGFLFSLDKRESSPEKVMVRSRIKLWYNCDIRRTKSFTDDNVVNFITVPSTGSLQRPAEEGGLLELRAPMDGLSRCDERGKPLSLSAHSNEGGGFQCEVFRRSSGASFGIKINNYDLVKV